MGIVSAWRDFDRAISEINNLRQEPSVSDLTRERIERAIAVTTIATCEEVHEAYERLGSWDDVIAAAEKTCEGWRMDAVVDGILAARELDNAANDGAKAARTLRLALRIAEIIVEEA